MTYDEYREKEQAEFNALPVFFAFGKDQFEKAMAERGLTANDTDKIYRLGETGGYYLKSDAKIIRDYFNKEDKLSQLMKDPEFAQSAFYHEMCNHEYGINWQRDWDVCSCFGSCEYSDEKSGPDYLREIGYSDTTIDCYLAARKQYYKAALENDWF